MSLHRVINAPFYKPEIMQAQPWQYVLPAFSYPVSWGGAAGLLATYDIGNTYDISIRRPIDIPTGDFMLAVSWVADGVTYRLKLWDAVDTLLWPVYAGESIGADALLEVWSAEDATATLAEDWSFYSGQMAELNDPMDLTPYTQPSNVVTLVAN
jgi:hypothetical protein